MYARSTPYMNASKPNGYVHKIYITASIPNGCASKIYFIASIPNNCVHTLLTYKTILYPVKALGTIFPTVVHPRFISLLVYPMGVYTNDITLRFVSLPAYLKISFLLIDRFSSLAKFVCHHLSWWIFYVLCEVRGCKCYAIRGY